MNDVDHLVEPRKLRFVDNPLIFCDSFSMNFLTGGLFDIAPTFETDSSSAGGVGLKGGGDVEQTASQEIHRETVAKYQRIVNETQLPRLNQMINIVHNEI